MKRITLRQLHESTGAWVREAARLGVILVTDRGRPIAKIEGLADDSTANPFLTRQLRPGYAKLLGTLTGGTDSTQLISEDRDGR
jgi:antitoxin (DNA-binding transcriptional repressor) of toxin-antitoxin stability system